MSSDRITVRLGDDIAAVDQLVGSGLYPNRSEVIRTATRGLLRRRSTDRRRVATDGGDTDAEAVELPIEAVDSIFDALESAMHAGKRSLAHDEVRPSTVQCAHGARDAYRELVAAHPDYELTEGGEADE
jgi:Arc/MetJ-type ribon-helix-helix transcriptional regulator